MTCSEVRTLLSISLVPGGVDARSLLGVEEHVAGCEGCRAEKLELLRALVTLELDLAEVPDLVPGITSRLDEEPARVRTWRRPLAAAAVLVASVGWVWLLRAGDETRTTPTAGPGPTTPPGRAATREDSLLLANGHELRLDRRIAWLPSDGPSGAHEDSGDGVVEDRGESIELKTGPEIPQLVPHSRNDEDEQVFPFSIEDDR